MSDLFSVIALSWSLTGGVMPSVTLNENNGTDLYTDSTMFVEYSVNASYPLFRDSSLFVESSMQNVFDNRKTIVSFDPIQDTYTFTTGVRIGISEIGWTHVCTHSVENLRSFGVSSQFAFGAFDRLYFRIDGKL